MQKNLSEIETSIIKLNLSEKESQNIKIKDLEFKEKKESPINIVNEETIYINLEEKTSYLKEEIKLEFKILENFFIIKETFPEFSFDISKNEYQNIKSKSDLIKFKNKIQNISFDTVLGNFLIDFDLKKISNLEKILTPYYKIIYPKENDKFDVNFHNDKDYEDLDGFKRGSIIKILSLGLKTENRVCKFADVVVAK